MNTNKLFYLTTTAIALFALAGGEAMAQGEPSATGAANTQEADKTDRAEAAQDLIQDVVVVTATRETTEIRKAPVAVTSVSGDTLASRGLTNLNELSQQLPNVQIGDSYVETRIAIRGVGGQSIQLGASPGVAYYVDGVYLERTGLAAATFFDVDRVEVLRGPQGALYGRNATGGAVNVIPNKPTPEFSGLVGASVGVDPWAYGLQGVLNGPINKSGTLSFRLSGQRSYDEGFTRNLNDSGPRRFDDADNYSVRSQVRYDSGPAFDANLALDYQASDTNGVGIYLLGTPSGAATVAELSGGTRPVLSDRAIYSNRGNNDKTFYGATLSVSSEGDWGGLDLKAGAHHTEIDLVSEADGTQVDYSYSFFEQEADQQFGELVYHSPNIGSFRLLAGATVLNETARQGIVVTTPPANRVTQIDASIPTFSYAVFGRVNYDITDNWRAFGGLRYSHDKKDVTEANNFLGSNEQEADWGDLTYEFGTSVDLSPRISAFIKYATGFKAGGFSGGSAAPAFDPEENSSVEVGIKGNLPDNRGRFSLVGFHTPYRDLQVTQIRGFSTFIDNAAEATINGVEFESVVDISRNLRFDLTASYLDAKFDSFTSIDSARPELGEIDLSGNHLPKAPEFSGSAGLDYTFEIPGGAKIVPAARVNWQDRVYYTEFNLPVASQEAVTRIDLNLNYESADGKLAATLFVNNVTDEQVVNNVIIASATLGSAVVANLDPGRRMGIQLTRRF
jgi:iron complex outermembrane recepter protein